MYYLHVYLIHIINCMRWTVHGPFLPQKLKRHHRLENRCLVLIFWSYI